MFHPNEIPKWLKSSLEEEGVAHQTFRAQTKLVCVGQYPILSVITIEGESFSDPTPAEELELCPHCSQELGQCTKTSNHNVKWEH